MAEMKLLALLPLSLLAASCFSPEPYEQQRPPYRRDGTPHYPYGPGPGPDRGFEPGPETGRYEPLQDGNRPPPPSARDDARPPAPRIDDNFDPEPAPAPQPKARPEYPVAEATAQPGRVLSPYPPYNVIDVEGYESGTLVKDPSNKKIFRVP